ncbi:hypothetical protein D3C73_1261710 [compost metagenome]
MKTSPAASAISPWSALIEPKLTMDLPITITLPPLCASISPALEMRFPLEPTKRSGPPLRKSSWARSLAATTKLPTLTREDAPKEMPLGLTRNTRPLAVMFP